MLLSNVCLLCLPLLTDKLIDTHFKHILGSNSSFTFLGSLCILTDNKNITHKEQGRIQPMSLSHVCLRCLSVLADCLSSSHHVRLSVCPSPFVCRTVSPSVYLLSHLSACLTSILPALQFAYLSYCL